MKPCASWGLHICFPPVEVALVPLLLAAAVLHPLAALLHHHQQPAVLHPHPEQAGQVLGEL
jgi:hypothetical protein